MERPPRSCTTTAIPPASASPSTTRSSTAFPVQRVLQEGDIVSVDVGAYIGGVPRRLRRHLTPAGRCPTRHMDLIRCDTGRASSRACNTPGRATACLTSLPLCRQYAECNGYSIVREYVGHGIGHQMHEPPEVPNYGKPGQWPPAAAGHDHRRGAHGQRRLRSHPADAGRLDGENCGRQDRRPTMRTPS